MTLASLDAQARAAGVEVVVVSDGAGTPTAAIAHQHRARLVALGERAGANAARNAGTAASTGELLIFIDDDIEAPRGWLQAVLDGARDAPGHDVFGGPIRARLEGGGPRTCGRESAPITTLDLGESDRDVELVWSANMAVRRGALERIGPFDETLLGCGEEEDWLRRYRTAGGRVRYLAAAGVDHRRTHADATVRALARAAYRRGIAARGYDARKGTAPSAACELRTLAGCAWHTVRRCCTNGVVLGAVPLRAS